MENILLSRYLHGLGIYPGFTLVLGEKWGLRGGQEVIPWIHFSFWGWVCESHGLIPFKNGFCFCKSREAVRVSLL